MIHLTLGLGPRPHGIGVVENLMVEGVQGIGVVRVVARARVLRHVMLARGNEHHARDEAETTELHGVPPQFEMHAVPLAMGTSLALSPHTSRRPQPENGASGSSAG